MGLIQSTEGLNRTKDRVGGNLLSLPVFGLELRLELRPSALLVLRPLDVNWDDTVSFPGT